MVAREVLRSIYEAQRKAVAAENANENVLTREVCPDKTGSLSSAGMDYQASDEGRSERLLSRKEVARSCGVGVSLGPTLTRCVLVSGHQEHCVRLGELGRGTLRNRKIQFFQQRDDDLASIILWGTLWGPFRGPENRAATG